MAWIWKESDFEMFIVWFTFMFYFHSSAAIFMKIKHCSPWCDSCSSFATFSPLFNVYSLGKTKATQSSVQDYDVIFCFQFRNVVEKNLNGERIVSIKSEQKKLQQALWTVSTNFKIWKCFHEMWNFVQQQRVKRRKRRTWKAVAAAVGTSNTTSKTLHRDCSYD